MESGFYYLQSRYYDPYTKRFINADVFASTGQGLLGYNMFAYCQNTPANSSDSLGLRRIEATTVKNESPEQKAVSFAAQKHLKFRSTSYTHTIYTYRTTTTVSSGGRKKDKVYASLHFQNGSSMSFSYTVHENGVASFNYDDNDFQTIIYSKVERDVANVIYDTVICINPSYSRSRTVDGIMLELHAHYQMYAWGILASHANPADMGKVTIPSTPGYDSNAWIFEWIATTGQTPCVYP